MSSAGPKAFSRNFKEMLFISPPPLFVVVGRSLASRPYGRESQMSIHSLVCEDVARRTNLLE
jgi:hypothetical protein